MHQLYTQQLWRCLRKCSNSRRSLSTKCLKSMSKGQVKAFLDSFDVVLSDCDGVLWKENEVIKGSPEMAAKFRELGKKFFYVTNHNSKTRTELAEKCKSMSYEATPDEILSAGYLIALYLKEKNFSKKVYIVGSEAISKELNAQGIQNFGVGPDYPSLNDNELDAVLSFKKDTEVGAVAYGWDMYFSVPKVIKAATYLQDPNVLFIGANPDLDRPSPNDNIFPAEAHFMHALESAAGRKAIIVGKPEPFVGEIIAKRYKVNPSRTLMIGDNPQTDILLGKRNGFKTLLVLSGVTSGGKLQKMLKSKDPVLPDYYADRLSDLLDCL